MTRYELAGRDEEPVPVPELTERVRQAWQLWHGMGDHRTRVAGLVPDLLADLQYATRVLEGAERRRALVLLAETYHLAQLVLAFQPAPELVMLTGGRAMAAAQEADSPRALAVAAWYVNHVFRDAGEQAEARGELAMEAARLLRPDRGAEDHARLGLLHLAAALSYAKVGKAGDAWRHWDRAEEAAQALGPSYTHPYLIFGTGMVGAYAVTIHADLVRGRSAMEAAARLDLGLMPSATRRSFHLVETARAHSIQGEDVAVVHLLKRAYEASPETVRFNLFARSKVMTLSESGNSVIRDSVGHLARCLGIAA